MACAGSCTGTCTGTERVHTVPVHVPVHVPVPGRLPGRVWGPLKERRDTFSENAALLGRPFRCGASGGREVWLFCVFVAVVLL